MFKLKNIMATPVITVYQDDSVYDAMTTLRRHNITGTPVTDNNGALVGIITEKDLLRFLYTAEVKDPKVKDFMTKDVICFDIEDSMINVADCFVKNEVRRVPIIEKNKVVGIISKKDIIDYILKMRAVGEGELALQSIHATENGHLSGQ